MITLSRAHAKLIILAYNYYRVMSYIYTLGIILFMVFVISGAMLIIKGFTNNTEYGQTSAILFFSGLFATILVCLSTSSYEGVCWLSNLSLLFGVVSLVCGLAARFIEGKVSTSVFWILTLILLPLGIFCRWWIMAQEYVLPTVNMY